MEIAISEPQTVFDLNINISLAFQKSNCSDPISFFDIVLQGGHFFGLHFIESSVFVDRALDFGLGDGCSWAIHLKLSNSNQIICWITLIYQI